MNLIVGLLFFVNLIFYLFKAGVPELTGDEAASYVSLIPFLQSAFSGQFLPSFLIYFHEPLQLLIQIPLIFGGLDERLARFPNIISGIFIFIVLFKIWKNFFSKSLTSLIFLLFLYTFSGYFFLSRLAMNLGVFGLLLSVYVYYAYRFYKSNKRDKIYRPLGWLFLATFVFVDALMTFPGFLFSVWKEKGNFFKIYRKPIFCFIFLVGVSLLFWFLASILGSQISGRYDWHLVAPARIFFRGANFGHLSLKENYEALTSFNSPIFVFNLVFFTIVSLLNKKSWIIWRLFLLPLVYFNLVKTPTLHLVFFYPMLILLAASGWDFVLRKVNFVVKIVLVSGFIFMIVINIKFIIINFSLTQSNGFKPAGSFIAEVTNPCEIVLTNIDGYTFRLYFGRKYSNEITFMTKYAVILEPNEATIKNLQKNGFRLEAVSNKVRIYKRSDSDSEVKNLSTMNNQDFRWGNLMPYTRLCQ